jgi:hypothetical protein
MGMKKQKAIDGFENRWAVRSRPRRFCNGMRRGLGGLMDSDGVRVPSRELETYESSQ